jgi:hypothetical protein
MKTVRKAIDDKLVKHLNPQAFVPMLGKLVPRDSVSKEELGRRAAMASPQPPLPKSFATPPSGPAGPAFQTKIKPTRARITGVGFFDKVHGQTGVSQLNVIELHPILKIQFL